MSYLSTRDTGPQHQQSLTRGTIAFVLVVSPQALVFLLTPGDAPSADLLTSVVTALAPVALVAGVLLHVHWKFTGATQDGVTVTCLALYGAHGWATTSLWLVREQAASAEWGLFVDASGVLAYLLVASCGRWILRAIDPLVLGIVLGLALSVLHAMVLPGIPVIDLPLPVVLVHGVLLAVAAAAVVAIVLRDGYDRDVTRRICAAAVLLAGARLALSTDPGDRTLTAILLAGGLGGALLLCGTVLDMLVSAMRNEAGARATAHRRSGAVAAERLQQEERLHDVRSALAGIASACTLLRRQDLPAPGRERLEEMLEAESGRLVRLLHDAQRRPDNGTQIIRIDDLIRPLVTAQSAQGRTVRWHPSGAVVSGDPDRISDALVVLLDNVARHAPLSEAEVGVASVGGRVLITVADHGPGISAEVAEQLFERGAKSPGSPGEGLGLHVARTLLAANGSTLELERCEVGTRFVIGLRAASSRHVERAIA